MPATFHLCLVTNFSFAPPVYGLVSLVIWSYNFSIFVNMRYFSSGHLFVKYFSMSYHYHSFRFNHLKSGCNSYFQTISWYFFRFTKTLIWPPFFWLKKFKPKIMKNVFLFFKHPIIICKLYYETFLNFLILKFELNFLTKKTYLRPKLTQEAYNFIFVPFLHFIVLPPWNLVTILFSI